MSGRTTHQGHQAPPLRSSQVDIVRRNRMAIIRLPDATQSWTVHDVAASDDYTRPSKKTMATLQRNDIIKRVDRVDPDGSGNPIRVYRVHPVARERAEEYASSIDTLPCCEEGTGFSNIGRSDWYLCSGCGECVHSRSLIEEVVL